MSAEGYQKLYKAVVEEKRLEHVSLIKLAAELDISYSMALRYYSHMLKFLAQPATCPTCGRTKDDVKNCRDVFHYL
ncbi:MAG TPA: hypothetical protein PKE03_10095 [Bacteroidales bacterium]|nr:hypothetical protein [Bacteroidales bacterium]